MFKKFIEETIELSKKDCNLDDRKISILSRYLEDIEALLVSESEFKGKVVQANITNIFSGILPVFLNEPIDNKVKEFYGYIVLNKKEEVIEEVTEEVKKEVTEEVIEEVIEEVKEEVKDSKFKFTAEDLKNMKWQELIKLSKEEGFDGQVSKENITIYLLSIDKNEKENKNLPKENT